MTDGRADDLNVGRLGFALGVVLMVLSLFVYLRRLRRMRIVRLDGRGLDEGRVGRLRRRKKVGFLVRIGTAGCSFQENVNAARARQARLALMRTSALFGTPPIPLRRVLATRGSQYMD